MEAKEGGRQIRRGNRLGNESIFGRAAPNQRKRVVNDQSGNDVTSNEAFIPSAPDKVFIESARRRKRRLKWTQKVPAMKLKKAMKIFIGGVENFTV
jgi:hypothetical protein